MRAARVTLAGLLCLAAAGCSTDVVDFEVKASSGSDLDSSGCKMIEVQFGLRCEYCFKDGVDAGIKGKCAKLGCQLVDAWTAECKSCWWSDNPMKDCVICSNKSGMYKDTCHAKSAGP